MKEPGISLFVITKNEAHNIAACLDSARALVQEIIIVDSYSTDGTVRICEKFGARIYQHPFENFTQQKNTALTMKRLLPNWLAKSIKLRSPEKPTVTGYHA